MKIEDKILKEFRETELIDPISEDVTYELVVDFLEQAIKKVKEEERKRILDKLPQPRSFFDFLTHQRIGQANGFNKCLHIVKKLINNR